jgi:hypothetical protein
MKPTSTQLKKQQLKQELAKIEDVEQEERIQNHYPRFKKLEGKFFKKRNRYSRGKEWLLYTKVIEIRPEDLYEAHGNKVTAHCRGYSFETDCDGKILINKKQTTYTHILGKQITEKEFNEAWNKMIDSMNSL